MVPVEVPEVSAEPLVVGVPIDDSVDMLPPDELAGAVVVVVSLGVSCEHAAEAPSAPSTARRSVRLPCSFMMRLRFVRERVET